MTHADLARVVEIAQASLPEAWTADGFASELDKATSVCLVSGDPVMAFALASIVSDELEVLSIAVDAHTRRSGTGRALLAALLDLGRARGVSRCFLEVRANNHAAIALYAGAGFARSGLRARYYADGEDALLMASALAT